MILRVEPGEAGDLAKNGKFTKFGVSCSFSICFPGIFLARH